MQELFELYNYYIIFIYIYNNYIYEHLGTQANHIGSKYLVVVHVFPF